MSGRHSAEPIAETWVREWMDDRETPLTFRGLLREVLMGRAK